MEFSSAFGHAGVFETVRPEAYEVFQVAQGQVDGVEQGVSQEQHEELVIIEGHAVVDPRTVMIHFQYTSSADGTVMAAIRFNSLTLVTISEISGGKIEVASLVTYSTAILTLLHLELIFA